MTALYADVETVKLLIKIVFIGIYYIINKLIILLTLIEFKILSIILIFINSNSKS